MWTEMNRYLVAELYVKRDKSLSFIKQEILQLLANIELYATELILWIQQLVK
jgi:hypothetical protein